MIKAVVFDFDGTLTGLTLDFGNMRKEVESIAATYLPAASLKPFSDLYTLEMIGEVEKILARKGTAFRQDAFNRLRDLEIAAAAGKEPYPYTRDVLRVLRGKGIKIGVMTRNCRDALKVVFPDIESYVDAIVTREDVRQVKPDPRHVSTVLLALHVPPGRAMLVGDHPTDVRAGETLAVVTVGVLTGRTTRREFEEAGADHIVDDIRGVPGLIESS
jgi:phosphoglycolate phosphatase